MTDRPPPPPPSGVDWNAEWQRARARASRRGDSGAWDRRAPSFGRHAGKSGYVERLIELLAPEPAWTVLDVGSGPGTVALPLAPRVAKVVALDFSPRMLELLRERAAAQGASNVVPVLGAWEDDWAALGVAPCDVALASRSLTVEDLGGAVRKLHGFALRRAVVGAPVGDGPVDRRVYQAAGRPFVPGPDYRYVLNMLRQLGVDPDVTIVPVADERRYASVDDAVESLGWMLADPAPEELRGLRAWLEGALARADDGLRLREPHPVEWAVLAWSTDRAL